MRKIIQASLAALAALTVANRAQASDSLTYAPAENWVKTIALPAATDPAKPAEGIVSVLLENVQVRLDNAGVSSYNEYAVRIENAQGLQGVQPSVLWNPDTDSVTINKVHLIRNGQVIDLLGKGQTFTILRREADLDKSMLNGFLTGVLQPEGVEVGDIVNYAYTMTRKDPVMQGKVEGQINNLFTDNIVDHMVLRAVWPKDRNIRWKATPDLAVKLNSTAEGNELLIDMTNVKDPDAIHFAPLRFNLSGHIELTQFASWQEMSQQLAPLYQTAATLTTDSPLKTEAAKIRAANPDPRAQAAAALHLVEERVRYVFLGMNLGGYVPANADLTWTRRFGDCKGKSALLLALLHELGIEADAVLVNSYSGDGYDNRLPTLALFDHVIVRARIDGKVYWLDATRYGDRDLESLSVPDLDWALPLTQPGSDLTKLTPPPADKPFTETFVTLDATAGLDAKAPAHLERIYRGDFAIQFNLAAHSITAAELDKHLREFWKDDYDWIEPATVSASFDPATGEEKLVLDGEAKMEWAQAEYPHGRRYETDGYGLGRNPDLKRDPGPHAHDPVRLSYPSYSASHETIRLPNKGVDFQVIGDSVDATLAGVAYKRTVAIKDGVFSMDASSRYLQREISYDEMEKATKELKALWDSVVYVEAPVNYKASEKDVAAITSGDPKTADEYAARAMTLQRNNQLSAAIRDYDAALKLEPNNDTILAQRGSARLFNKDSEGAKADFDAAIKLNPRAWLAYNGRGMFYMRDGKYAQAIAAFSRAIELNSDNNYARENRIRAYLASEDYDSAIEDAELYNSLQPDSTSAKALLAFVYVHTGQPEKAVAIYDERMKADPANAQLPSELGDMLLYCSPRLPDKDACTAQHQMGIHAYDESIAIKPTAYAYTARSQMRGAKDFDLKMKDINAALALEPQSVFTLTARASLYLSMKEYEKARADVASVLAIDPDFEQAYQVRATTYEQQNMMEEALRDWDHLIEISPKNASWLNSACWTRATHNIQLDKALSQCEAAAALSPRSSAILDSRAFVKLRLGQYDAAIADYDAALAIEPKQADSLYGRGIAKRRKGDIAGSDADLKAARDIYAGMDKIFADYGIYPDNKPPAPVKPASTDG
ncbi:MAG: tetratricopeptide repeat protein [Asticcacaulis sp.]|uniref:tetratricopeptide repeat protein n=1 Tax=Asticcacaulis sp. TaxID=1872648 RepID=UPI0039E70D95